MSSGVFFLISVSSRLCEIVDIQGGFIVVFDKGKFHVIEGDNASLGIRY